MNGVVIELKNLKKYYGKSRGVEDVSLKLKKGEIYGFIGPNGSGKSTTLRSIMGLINKTSGYIYINGMELDINNTDITIKQLFDYHELFYNKNLKKRRSELVKLLKIDESKKIENLSLGNLKKVGIVLSLMHEPEILILDEPTSGLDPVMQNVFHDILLKEKEKGTTILYSSHILNEVSNVCDRVGFIKDGFIIKEDLMENIKKDNYTYLKIKSNDINKIKKNLNLKIFKENDSEVVFINNLDSNILLSKLSKYKLDSILIEEVPLEDLFMKYYK